ncbi:MAG: hypothetical protein K0S11_790, partial [Gammaproteobacteria bacterium]|nr:hypothetical protein [Gammaproteobacteria bacterium]
MNILTSQKLIRESLSDDFESLKNRLYAEFARLSSLPSVYIVYAEPLEQQLSEETDLLGFIQDLENDLTDCRVHVESFMFPKDMSSQRESILYNHASNIKDDDLILVFGSKSLAEEQRFNEIIKLELSIVTEHQRATSAQVRMMAWSGNLVDFPTCLLANNKINDRIKQDYIDFFEELVQTLHTNAIAIRPAVINYLWKDFKSKWSTIKLENSQAWRYFTGNAGKESQADLRRYDNGYDTQAIGYLIHSQPSIELLTFVTTQSGELDERVIVGEEIEYLVQLRTLLNRPIGFITIEPNTINSSHFIAGFISLNHQLLLVNPLGLPHHRGFYQALKKLNDKLNFKAIYLSTHRIQQDEKAPVSCGPLCVELLRAWQINPPDLASAAFKQAKPAEKEELTYVPVAISLPPTLTQLMQENNKENLIQLRQTHAELLKDKAQEDVMSNEDFWLNQCDNAPLQVLIRKLLNKEITLLSIQDTPEYQQLLSFNESNSSISKSSFRNNPYLHFSLNVQKTTIQADDAIEENELQQATVLALQTANLPSVTKTRPGTQLQAQNAGGNDNMLAKYSYDPYYWYGLQKEKSPAQLLFETVQQFYQQGKFQKAIEHLQTILNLPDEQRMAPGLWQAKVYHQLACCYALPSSNKTDTKKARKYFECALQQDNLSLSGLAHRIRCDYSGFLYRQKDYPAAYQHAQIVLQSSDKTKWLSYASHERALLPQAVQTALQHLAYESITDRALAYHLSLISLQAQNQSEPYSTVLSDFMGETYQGIDPVAFDLVAQHCQQPDQAAKARDYSQWVKQELQTVDAIKRLQTKIAGLALPVPVTQQQPATVSEDVNKTQLYAQLAQAFETM